MSSYAMPGPGGYAIGIPTGPPPDYKALLENDPFYLQQKQWLEGDAATTKARIEQDRALAEALYGINVKQATQSASGGGGGGGDYGLAEAERRAVLEREAAAHDAANQAEYMREALASRGMASSGQVGWEQGEQAWQLGMMNKQIESDLAGRRSAASSAAASAASARSSAQAGLALQLQEMQLRHQAGQTGYTRELEDLPANVARGVGGAALDAYGRLQGSGGLNAPTIPAIWDPNTGRYVTSDGRSFDQFGNSVSGPAAGGGGGGGSTPLPPALPPPPPPPVPTPYPQAPVYNSDPVYNAGTGYYGI